MSEASGEIPQEEVQKTISRRRFLEGTVMGGIAGAFGIGNLHKREHTDPLIPSEPAKISTERPETTSQTLPDVPSPPETVDHEYYDTLTAEQQKLVDETAYHLASVYTDVMDEDYYPTDDAKREFFRYVTEMGIRLNPNNPNLGNQIAAIMYWESGFSPKRVSENGSEGLGLIQFTGVVPSNLGTSPEELRQMSPKQQLAYVERFFRSQHAAFGGDFDSFESLYTFVIAPQKSGADSFAELYSKDSKEARRNGVLDKNKDGFLRKREAADVVRDNAVRLGENPAFL